MTKSQTSEEIRLELIQDLGTDLGTLFYHLSNRLMEVYSLWKDYKYLFVEKKERVEILNNSASGFFGNVQRIFRDKVILDLCKLTDPSFSRKNENITYSRVLELVKPKLRGELIAKNDKLKILIAELKDHRNKRIGHNDLKVAEQIRNSNLLEITIESIDGVFLCIQELFNSIQNYYQNSTTHFRFLEEQPSVRGLLHVLYDGLEYAERREERFREGIYDEDDLKRSQLQL